MSPATRGPGDASIIELASLAVVGYGDGIIGDTIEPDATPRKVLVLSKLGALAGEGAFEGK